MFIDEPQFIARVGMYLSAIALLVKDELFTCIVICFWIFAFVDWLYWKWVEAKYGHQEFDEWSDDDDDDETDSR